MTADVSPRAKIVFRTLEDAGYECFLVGGSVRDRLLGRDDADLDFTTNARPDALLRVFPGSHYPNRFGTVLAVLDGEQIEITTYRGEGRYSDHRHPDQVAFVDHLEDDLGRRDFTINAMAMDSSGGIVDPFGGKADLERRLVRAVGDPAERLAEDPLRMMRAVRLAAQLDLRIDRRTRFAIAREARLLSMISRERIRDELLKILASGRALMGFDLLGRLDLLPAAVPGLATASPELRRHARQTLRRVRGDALLRLAGLLHVLAEDAVAFSLHPSLPASLPQGERGDGSGLSPLPGGEGQGEGPPEQGTMAGQLWAPETEVARRSGQDTGYALDPGSGVSPAQRVPPLLERQAAPERARDGLRRELAGLRLSGAELERVARVVDALPLLPPDLEAAPAVVRRLLSRLGPRLPDLLELARAHRLALDPKGANLAQLRALRRLAEQAQRDHAPLSLGDLALSGDDLLAELELVPGPRVGGLLELLLDRVLDEPALNERGTLLKIARTEVSGDAGPRRG